MADTKIQAGEKTRSKGTATTPAAAPAPPQTGIAANPSVGVRIGSEPNPLSKGQRKHLRRQKEAGQIKVTSRRSQGSR
jgi:hypothetical protein